MVIFKMQVFWESKFIKEKGSRYLKTAFTLHSIFERTNDYSLL